MLLIAVGFNLIQLVAEHVNAPVLQAALHVIDYGHFFTAGIAAGCVATGEIGMLGVIALAILLVTWPTDLVHLASAFVGGGLIGLSLRSFIRSHYERQPLPGQRPH